MSLTDRSDSDSNSSSGPSPRKKLKGAPYIPSYMDVTNGPEPCVVCADAATGYHYRCMTCEGCKGFFRRTVQKDLRYHCKWDSNCIIDKNSRNQCQQCRFKKCVTAGMAMDLVLNEKQRSAKRKLIEDNRERRRQDQDDFKIHAANVLQLDVLTNDDKNVISEISLGYELTEYNMDYTNLQHTYGSLNSSNNWNTMANEMTPSIIKVVEFAKCVPGFSELFVEDQILLLRTCCMEVMILRVACRYDTERQGIILPSNMILTKTDISSGPMAELLDPILEFAANLSRLKLDQTERILLSAVLLIQCDRSGLKDPDDVEAKLDRILGAFKRYVAVMRPSQPVHWAKILMKVTDLRTISTRHAEKVLCLKVNSPGEIPPLFVQLFS